MPKSTTDTGTRIAALLTCHNRRKKTLECLRQLTSQADTDASIEIYLVDDGSTDGTSAAVTELYPTVNIIKGNGALFWTGGMRLAMQAANDRNYDFFLWVNDDTSLYPDATARLLESYGDLMEHRDQPIVLVGSIRDPGTGEFSYGGSKRVSRWHPLRFTYLPPMADAQKCDVFNGNCVLIPRKVVDVIGNLHPALTHAAGDYEYALRANKAGFDSWVAPGYFGECTTNSTCGTWLDNSLPLWQRYKKLFGTKGQPPLPRLIYYFRHGGPLWFITYPLVYFRPLLTSAKKLLSRP
jgi:GT2 family glycosyltransferase